MAQVYDIAAGIKPAEPVSALNRARNERASRRLTEAQAILMEQNAANDERDFRLEERKVEVAEGRNVIDAGELRRKYDEFFLNQWTGASEDQKRGLEGYEALNETAANLYDQIRSYNGSEEQAQQAANAVFAQFAQQIPGNLRGRIYNHQLGQAIREKRQENIERVGQRVVTLPGQEGAEMELFRDKRTNQMFIETPRGRQFVTSDQVTTPTSRVRTGSLVSEQANLREAQYNTQNYIDSVVDAVKMIEEEPDANTLVARMTSFATDMQQNAEAFIRLAGGKMEKGSNDPGTFAAKFNDLAITSARTKSLITHLAFQKALASSQSGRDVSNADVERFIGEIGASSANPEAFKQVLIDTAIRMDRNFRNRWAVVAEEDEGPFKGDFGLNRLTTTKRKPGEVPEGVDPAIWNFMTPEQKALFD